MNGARRFGTDAGGTTGARGGEVVMIAARSIEKFRFQATQ